jgi:acetyl esterase/lipase
LFYQAFTITAAEKYETEKNVVIGMVSGLALVMDVHYPEKPNGYAIVHVSGSGFGRSLAYNAPPLSERQVDIWGAPLVEKGYTIFSLNHRAIPRFKWPDLLLDIQRAVRYIRYHADNYGKNPHLCGCAAKKQIPISVS